MAARKTASRPTSDLRQRFAVKLHTQARDMAERLFDTAGEVDAYLARCPEIKRAEALDAGHEVEANGWEIARLIDGRVSPFARVTLAADGTLHGV
jgi:hypothetical protein